MIGWTASGQAWGGSVPMQRNKVVIAQHPNGHDAHHQSVSHAIKAAWPTGGARLAAGVQPAGFLPVTEEILAEIVRRLVAALDPEKIILFGSYVYGSPSGDSDVDILVIMQTTARPADRYVSVSRVIRPRPFPLDFLVKTPDEIARALAKGDGFIHEIITRGRVLYARCD
jgi:predicted nucleotidyltransferase